MFPPPLAASAPPALEVRAATAMRAMGEGAAAAAAMAADSPGGMRPAWWYCDMKWT